MLLFLWKEREIYLMKFIKRTASDAHPQMRQIARPMLKEFRARFPVLFDDVGVIE